MYLKTVKCRGGSGLGPSPKVGLELLLNKKWSPSLTGPIFSLSPTGLISSPSGPRKGKRKRYFKCGERERETKRETGRHINVKHFRHVKEDRER